MNKSIEFRVNALCSLEITFDVSFLNDIPLLGAAADPVNPQQTQRDPANPANSANERILWRPNPSRFSERILGRIATVKHNAPSRPSEPSKLSERICGQLARAEPSSLWPARPARHSHPASPADSTDRVLDGSQSRRPARPANPAHSANESLDGSWPARSARPAHAADSANGFLDGSRRRHHSMPSSQRTQQTQRTDPCAARKKRWFVTFRSYLDAK